MRHAKRIEEHVHPIARDAVGEHVSEQPYVHGRPELAELLHLQRQERLLHAVGPGEVRCALVVNDDRDLGRATQVEVLGPFRHLEWRLTGGRAGRGPALQSRC